MNKILISLPYRASQSSIVYLNPARKGDVAGVLQRRNMTYILPILFLIPILLPACTRTPQQNAPAQGDMVKPNPCENEDCQRADENADAPQNHMPDNDEVAKEQGPDCLNHSDTGCENNPNADENADANHNHMLDKFETAKDQGVDCLEKHNAGCIDGFCDSFLDYKCSTRCTSDEQCVSDEFFCRDDGRCAPKAFVSVWRIAKDNTTLKFPGGRTSQTSFDGCNYTIDWGDGSKESFSDCAITRDHKYAKAGDYSISVVGTILQWGCAFDLCYYPPGHRSKYVWDRYTRDYVIEKQKNPIVSLIEIRSFGPVLLSVRAFQDAEGLLRISQVDIPNGNITDMSWMFHGATTFNQPLEKWDTSKVTNMRWMFDGASAFNQPLEKWDTSNVTNMRWMFDGASAFNQPLEKWDTSNVTNMSEMFLGATAFNQPLEKWDTSNVEDMSNMFSGATAFNQPLEKWNTSNVIRMDSMFSGATAFNQPLEKWNTSKVDGMMAMFSGATAFNQPIESWNTSNVKDMRAMFSGATAFNQPLEKWNTSNVWNMRGMFSGATAFNQPIESWNTSNVKDMSAMFKRATAFNQPLEKWNTSNVTEMGSMFKHATVFNQPLEMWDTSNVDGMMAMFMGATAFNQPLEKWNTSNVINMNEMFKGASSFNQSLEKWDTIKVKYMRGIFDGAGLSQENWNMMKITKSWANAEMKPPLGPPKTCGEHEDYIEATNTCQCRQGYVKYGHGLCKPLDSCPSDARRKWDESLKQCVCMEDYAKKNAAAGCIAVSECSESTTSRLSSDQKVCSCVEGFAWILGECHKVGDTVTFGRYRQSATEDKQDPLSWVILEITQTDVLLLSEYILEANPYHPKWVDITWDKSDIRSWLNGLGTAHNLEGVNYTGEGFIDMAFNDAERAAILKVTNSNVGNKKSPKGGKNTKDHVFLLSYAEANKYFASDEARRANPTPYALDRAFRLRRIPDESDCGYEVFNPRNRFGGWGDYYGDFDTLKDIYTNMQYFGYWWLRSQSDNQVAADVVTDEGDIFNFDDEPHSDTKVFLSKTGVRPALRLDRRIFVR